MPSAYKCPSCGSTTELLVEVIETAQLIQSDDNIETYVDSASHFWDGDSRMWCTCGEGELDGSSKAKQFRVPS